MKNGLFLVILLTQLMACTVNIKEEYHYEQQSNPHEYNREGECISPEDSEELYYTLMSNNSQ